MLNVAPSMKFNLCRRYHEDGVYETVKRLYPHDVPSVFSEVRGVLNAR